MLLLIYSQTNAPHLLQYNHKIATPTCFGTHVPSSGNMTSHTVFLKKNKYSMEFSRLRNVQTASEAQHASYSINTETFLETKRPGREANHSPPTAEQQIPSAKANCSSPSQDISLIVCNLKFHYRIYSTRPVLSQMNPLRSSTPHSSKIHFRRCTNIPLCLDTPSRLFF
jgi:hypothetical protein